MTASYSQAAIPEPFQILGFKLKPFCLGHYLLMQRFDCAFVAQEPTQPNVSDLLLGLLICSQTYEEFIQFLDQPGWLEEIQKWGRHCGDFDIPDKIELFAQYLKEGAAEPVVWFEDEGKPSGAHWTQCLKVALLELGYDHNQAMNMPLTEAFADFYKVAENRGIVRIATEDEIETMERLDSGELQEDPA